MLIQQSGLVWVNKQNHSLSPLIHDLLEIDQEVLLYHWTVVEVGGTLADEVVTQVNFLYLLYGVGRNLVTDLGG